MKKTEYDVMVAAHVCLDIIPRFNDTGARTISDIMTPGKLVLLGPAGISTGGPVSNTGIALRRLGNRVCFSTRIGDDAFGQVTLGLLQEGGNAEGVHIVPGSVSSYTVVVAPPGIDRVILHHPGTNDEYGAEDLDKDLVSKCRLFHFGYPPLMRRMYENEGEELLRIFRMAKEAGATTSCDMALPDPHSDAGRVSWRKILEKILPYVDILLPSVEEAFYMLEPEKFMQMKHEHGGAELIDYLSPDVYSHISEQLLALGAKMTSLKSGHRGFYFRTSDARTLANMGAAKPGSIDNWANRELWHPAFTPPHIGSAIGSGDSSIAGFLTAFLDGCSIEKSLRAANCLGWQNVQVLDALSGVTNWEETQRLMNSALPVNPIHIDSPAWRENADSGIWHGPNDIGV